MTMIADLAPLLSNPGIALAAAALAVPLLPPAIARAYAPAAVLAALIHALGLEPGGHGALTVAGMSLQVLQVDAVTRLLAPTFLAVALLGSIYGWREDGRIGRMAWMLLAGGAAGAVHTGDLLSFLVLSGVATTASVLVVWSGGTERAVRAGMRYAVVQVAAVVILLAGVVMYTHATGVPALGTIPPGTPGYGMMLFALAIQAAFPLLHSWLKDAYPEASPAGSVFLASFTSNLALYALYRCYPGTDALVWVGAGMLVLAPVAAAFEDDLRRALAWLLNAQLGIAVLAIGTGTEAALDGALAATVTRTFSMALMFMALGAVLSGTGSARASEVGGLRASMPWTSAFYLIGAAALGLPLLAGSASVPLVLAAAGDAGPAVQAALLLGVALCFMVALARIPAAAFLGPPAGPAGKEAPTHMRLAMAGMAVLCLAAGVWPPLLQELLPNGGAAMSTLIVPALSVAVAAAVGVAMFAALRRIGLLAGRACADVPDVDWIYRRALPPVVVGLGRGVGGAWQRLTDGVVLGLQGMAPTAARVFSPGGLFGRAARIGNAVAWVAALLLVVLIVGYSAE